MKKEEIFITDWKRILFGDAPFEFMLEIFFRTCIIYIVLLIVARLLGKRMSGQLTLTETAVMVTLGAIVSPAMQLPDRGVLMGVIALVCTLIFQRGINLWGFKNPKFEKLSQGQSSLLVKDGVMIPGEMRKIRMTKQELFASLRSSNIYNLGKVERVYMEGCGILSIFTREDEKPGLSMIPPRDEDLCKVQQEKTSDGQISCMNCGFTISSAGDPEKCPNCENKSFSPAVLSL